MRVLDLCKCNKKSNKELDVVMVAIRELEYIFTKRYFNEIVSLYASISHQQFQNDGILHLCISILVLNLVFKYRLEIHQGTIPSLRQHQNI